MGSVLAHILFPGYPLICKINGRHFDLILSGNDANVARDNRESERGNKTRGEYGGKHLLDSSARVDYLYLTLYLAVVKSADENSTTAARRSALHMG